MRTRRSVDEPTLERLAERRLNDHDASFGDRHRNALTGQSSASLVDAVSKKHIIMLRARVRTLQNGTVLSDKDVAWEQFANSVAGKSWQARVTLCIIASR